MKSVDVIALASGRNFDISLDYLEKEEIKKAIIMGLFNSKMHPRKATKKFKELYLILEKEVIDYAIHKFYQAVKTNDISHAVKIKTTFNLDYDELFLGLNNAGIRKFKTLNSFLFTICRSIELEINKKESIMQKKGVVKNQRLDDYDIKKDLFISHLGRIQSNKAAVQSLILQSLESGNFKNVVRIMDYFNLGEDLFSYKEVQSALYKGLCNLSMKGKIRIIHQYRKRFKIRKETLELIGI